MSPSLHSPPYAAFADALPVHVCVLNREGRVQWVNRAWTRFAADNGATSACIGPGADYLAICATADGAERQDGEAVARGLRLVLMGEAETFSHIYPCHGPQASRWFQLHASRYGDGAVLLHIAVDPPDGPETRAHRLLSSVAHELRAPLTAIAGYSDLLSSGIGGTLPARGLGYASTIRDSVRYLNGLIEDMLDLDDAGRGTLSLRATPTGLVTLADEALRLAQHTANRNGVRLVHDVPPQAMALIDRRRLTQVLINLLVNAAKFSPDGGEVRLSARRGTGWTLLVSDQGVGMRPEDIPALLKPYGRATAARDKGVPGLGLGLPLSKALVELHGGDLRIDSTPGVGTTVAIILPAWRTVNHLP